MIIFITRDKDAKENVLDLIAKTFSDLAIVEQKYKIRLESRILTKVCESKIVRMRIQQKKIFLT